VRYTVRPSRRETRGCRSIDRFVEAEIIVKSAKVAIDRTPPSRAGVRNAGRRCDPSASLLLGA
jgi:hypothetical protein